MGIVFCAADPMPATEAPCGQYGFRCTNSHEYVICETPNEVDDNAMPIITHPCPKDMLCDEDNESFCSLPFDEMYPIVMGRPYGGSKESVQELVDSPYLGVELQKARRVHFGLEGETVEAMEEEDKETTTEAVEDNTPCITPNPPPFECDMLGYFTGE